MSATRVTIEIPIATHRRLRSFAQREGYRMKALVARGLTRFLDEVESHNAVPSSLNQKTVAKRGAELSARESVAAEERTSANIPVAPLPGREQDSTSVS